MEAQPPKAVKYHLDIGEDSGGLSWQHSQRKPSVSLRAKRAKILYQSLYQIAPFLYLWLR